MLLLWLTNVAVGQETLHQMKVVADAESKQVLGCRLRARSGVRMVRLSGTRATSRRPWPPKVRFATDSSLEGDGFELPVPGRETVKPSWETGLLYQNGSGSVGEPKVRIHLPPVASPVRSRLPSPFATETDPLVRVPARGRGSCKAESGGALARAVDLLKGFPGEDAVVADARLRAVDGSRGSLQSTDFRLLTLGLGPGIP
jgi:hypothetical protein